MALFPRLYYLFVHPLKNLDLNLTQINKKINVFNYVSHSK